MLIPRALITECNKINNLGMTDYNHYYYVIRILTNFTALDFVIVFFCKNISLRHVQFINSYFE
jgi:hypothetical protein